MRFQCAFCTTIVRSNDGDSRLNCPNCGKQNAVPKSRFETGCVIDDFVIENVIGYGGMATVYLAKQLSLDRPVALKVLSDDYCKREQFRASFLKEAKAAARLNHPNIIQAMRAAEEDGILFYAMEYIQGQTLANKIEVEKTLQVDTALNIIQQCAEALHTAWTQEQLIHRDIKPENIMLAEDGYAKIMDLGIAITVAEAESAEVSGTPTYMAPEQFRRERLDCRTDIYSLGVTLYHALVGFPPFDGDNVKEIARKHVFNQLQFPTNDLIYLPQRIKRLVSKMMAKDPNDRYQDYEEILGDVVALRKRLAPDRDQVPNVHTISFSKYRLHEKMSDSPSEVYRRRSDKKKKVGIAKEQTERTQKEVSSRGPWIVIGTLVAIIILLSIGMFHVMQGGNSEFVDRAEEFLASESAGSADLENLDPMAKDGMLAKKIDRVDKLLEDCPEDPSSNEREARRRLRDHRQVLRDEFFRNQKKLIEIERDDLAKRNEAFEKARKTATRKDKNTGKLSRDLKLAKSELAKRTDQLAESTKTVGALRVELRKREERSKTAEQRLKELRTKLTEDVRYAAEVSIVRYCRAYRFSGARRVVESFATDYTMLNTWASAKTTQIRNAEKIYDAVVDSGPALRGVILSDGAVVVQVGSTTATVLMVNKENIQSREEVSIVSIKPQDMIIMAQQNWQSKTEFDVAKYDFCVCTGTFSIAKSMCKDKKHAKRAKELSSFIRQYLKQRVKEIKAYLRAGERTLALSRYRSLKAAYKTLEEFKAIEGELEELKRD